MNTIGKRIQYLLDKDAMTSYQFCRQTGFSEASLSRILHSSNKNRRIKESNIQLIIEFFKVSRKWLVRGEGEIYSSYETPEFPSINNLTAQEMNINYQKKIETLNRRIELLFQQLEKLSHENEELKTQISKKKTVG